MKRIEDLVREIPTLAGLPDPHMELIAGCGQTASFHAGDYVFHDGERADTFYAIRSGQIALELVPPVGPPLVIETIHEGDVLGWSWLFAPYRTRFDARAVDTVHAIAFDGGCLRGKCDSDHDLGYELMARFAAIIVERLQATRIRLLDVYGAAGAGV